MGKQPAFQFYPNDWSRDLEEHPLEIEGAWIRICCKLWWSDTRGELTRTYDQWGRILGVNPADAERILTYLGKYNVCYISVTCNGDVTVRSRRMWREDKERQQAAERVRRHRGQQSCNADVTIASSSSPSSSTTNTKKTKTNTLAATYDFSTHQWINLNGNMEVWTKAFPAVNLQAELKRMSSWLEANPKNKKSNYTRFIHNWLTRAQDKAPRVDSDDRRWSE